MTPRVLVVSHNVFARNTPMGKTLRATFAGWEKDRIAQVYFHSEVPTDPVCENYFRYTDVDAARSVLFRFRQGQRLGAADVRTDLAMAENTGAWTGVYLAGRKRAPWMYLLRDGLWRISGWKHSGMLKWAEEFRPEVMFFASGDSAFSYRVLLTLAKRLKVPYVVVCYDDYYLFNINHGRFLGDFRQRRFMKTVRETLAGAAAVWTLNDTMAEAYGKLFGRECGVLRTAAESVNSAETDLSRKNGIAYIGALGLGRERQLTEIADVTREVREALEKEGADASLIPEQIDVYSGDNDPKLLEVVKTHPGIRFRGSIPGSEVPGTIRKYRAVIHTESFDPLIRERVKYSMSTKIPDSLASGTCLLAYGPEESAPMEYLRKHGAAFTASSREELAGAVRALFTDDRKYLETAEKAVRLARENHDREKVRVFVREGLARAASGGKTEEGKEPI